MNFTTHEDIKAPIAYVYQRITNFEAFERQALRHGAQVVRVDGTGPVQVGSAWDVAFTFRNKDRELRATVAELIAPQELAIDTDAKGLASDTRASLLALSPQTTRVEVKIALSAKSLSARLLLQSLKLARSNLQNRFEKRVREQLRGIQADYQRGA
ncbi:MAG: SRPBCC family protein [Pseudomonadota bacterium]